MNRGQVVAALAAGALVLSGCGTTWSSGDDAAAGDRKPSTSATPGSPSPSAAATSTAPSPTPSVTPTPAPPAEPTPPPPAEPTPAPTPAPTQPPAPETPPAARDTLKPGDSGEDVLAMQQRLAELGYWLGNPDGTWGSLTTQAVYAVQKANGLARDGVAGPITRARIAEGVRPETRAGGTGIEIDLKRQLLLVVREGAVKHILNTSTGSNVPYVEMYEGREYRGSARTPTGSYAIFREVDKLDKGPLGSLYRPKYFNGGIAVHGAASIPPTNVSHGCARLSNSAMDLIWANNYMPIRGKVTVY